MGFQRQAGFLKAGRPQRVCDAWSRAVAVAIPEFRAKFVRLPHGQTEISLTPANKTSVINSRIGFNPLLNCPRRRMTPELQAERDQENRQRSAKRARQNIRFLIKSIFDDCMLTFNYRENLTDRARVKSDWKGFVRLFHIRFPDWSYLAELENKRGALCTFTWPCVRKAGYTLAAALLAPCNWPVPGRCERMAYRRRKAWGQVARCGQYRTTKEALGCTSNGNATSYPAT